MRKKMSIILTVLLIINIDMGLLWALPSAASSLTSGSSISNISMSGNLNSKIIVPGKKNQKPLNQEKNLLSSGKGSLSNVQNYSVQSYKEWKQEKIQKAANKVALVRTQIIQLNNKKLNLQNLQNLQKTESSSSIDLEIEKLEAQLKNYLFSLEVAQQLTVQDYFAIYLTKLENRKDAYKGAAEKMNTEEITELINAFADSFSSIQSNGLASPSASGVAYEGKIK